MAASTKTIEQVEAVLIDWIKDIVPVYNDGMFSLRVLFARLGEIEGNKSFRMTIRALQVRLNKRYVMAGDMSTYPPYEGDI